jgi:hypothetical protein
MTEKPARSRYALPNFANWFSYFFALIPLLLLEWKIYDHEFHQAATNMASAPKHPLMAFTIPLLILGAGWQEYRNLKSEIEGKNDMSLVLDCVKERILSILSYSFATLLLLLIIY